MDVLIYGKMDWDIMVPEDQRGPHLVLYRNNGDGTFTREEKAVFPKGNPDNNGVNYAIAVADYDRDGYVDFFVSGNLDDSAKESEVHPGRMAFLYKNIDGTGEFKRMDIASTKGGVYTKEIKDEESGEVVVMFILPTSTTTDGLTLLSTDGLMNAGIPPISKPATTGVYI